MSANDSTRAAALEAIRAGRQIVAVPSGLKKPRTGGWQHTKWDPATTPEEFDARIRDEFKIGVDDSDEPYNIGVVLGETSGHLVDVDLDHFRTNRLKDFFLPKTLARSGRASRLNSHYWYIVTDQTGPIPGTRRYKMPDNQTVTVEYRHNGAQTILPPSIHPSGEQYRWTHDRPWGGAEGPAVVDGRRLALQVSLLALGTVLIDGWPTVGSRHDAYLALTGGLLRMGDGVVHPFWERNAVPLIRAMAEATNDDSTPDERESEVMGTTIRAIRDGKNVWGFPRLAEIMSSNEYTGDQYVKTIRRIVAEIEQLAGFQSRQALAPASPAAQPPSPPSGPSGTPTGGTPGSGAPSPDFDPEEAEPDEAAWNAGGGTDEEEALGSWAAVDLEPYLSGQYKPVEPEVLVRADGRALFYPGRLNMLFAPSESGKTLLCLYTAKERIEVGERVLYLDFEDDPTNTIERLRAMGLSDEDLRLQFTYIRPDEPIASMQRDHWGGHKATAIGESNAAAFARVLETVDPTLIIADGMTSIYGLHGLDSNNSVETDVITSWLKSLSRNGRTTTIVIDHMAKASGRGDMPLGSQHKVSMVQGTLIQVWPKTQPVLGGIGELELIVLKDRPGQVRKYAGKLNGKAQVAAIVTIDSSGTYDNGAVKTIVTVDSPPTQAAQQAAAQANAAATARLQADAAKAFQKDERNRVLREVILGAWIGRDDATLTRREIWDSVGPAWIGTGERGPNVPGKIPGGFAVFFDTLLVPSTADGSTWLSKLGSTSGARYVLSPGVSPLPTVPAAPAGS